MEAKFRKRLKVYRAMDNDHRLSILTVLLNNPNIAFNDLARKTEIERGLLAYHVGVLKDVGLVEGEYKRESKKFSRYRLTDEGTKVLKEFRLDERRKEKKNLSS